MFERGADFAFGISATARVANKAVDITSQNRGSPASIIGGYRLRDTRAPAAVAREPSGILQIGVRARDRIRRNAQIDCELAHRGKRISGTEIAALDEFTKLRGDLLKRRYVEIGIDGQRYASHDARGAREARRA
jgi:hypothetical protein